MSDRFEKTMAAAAEMGYPASTISDHIRELAPAFSDSERERYGTIIQKAESGEVLTEAEEKQARALLRNYEGQKRGLMERITDRIPGWIEEGYLKTIGDGEVLHYYSDGVYVADLNEKHMREIIESEFGKNTSNRMISDVIGKIKRRTFTDSKLFNSERVVNLQNGVLDLETLQLRPHSPDCLSTVRLPITYDPDADCPRIQQFFREVCQPEDISLIEELFGWLLWPDYQVHRAVMLIGQGRNGKGTLLRLIEAFIGEANVAHKTLQELAVNRFSKAALFGKMANIGGDLPARGLADTSTFRMLTGGDIVSGEHKYGHSFDFRNKAKMFFSSNDVPRSPDDTFAYFSRWIILEFKNTFTGDCADDALDSKLAAETSGLLNLAIAGLARLKASKWQFSYRKTVDEVRDMYLRASDPVIAFLQDWYEPSDFGYVTRGDLLRDFVRYCNECGRKPISSEIFFKSMRSQAVIPIDSRRIGSEPADREWCFTGLQRKSFPSEVGRSKQKVSESSEVCKSLLRPTSSLTLTMHEEEDREIVENRVWDEVGRSKQKVTESSEVCYVQAGPENFSQSSDAPQEQNDTDGPRTGKIDRPTPIYGQVRVRILAKDGYRTQTTDPENAFHYIDRTYPCGEVVAVYEWKAKQLVERGAAVVV